jgi:CTP synthase (UTP-ammonia lyase)
LVDVAPGTRAVELYGATQVVEDYYCNYGVNPDYDRLLERHGLCISGRGETGEIRIVELPAHPFFLATLFLPQARSVPSAPHPLIAGYASAVRARTYAGGPEGAAQGKVPSSRG